MSVKAVMPCTDPTLIHLPPAPDLSPSQPQEASLTTAPPPNPERERTYQLADAMTFDTQLPRMSDNLRAIR